MCASNSCPYLRREAYTPDKIEQMLDEAARAFINNPPNLQIDAKQDRVTLHCIFYWYRKDFEDSIRSKNIAGNGNLLLAYLRIYANEANRQALDRLADPDVKFTTYDWGINDVHAPTSTGELDG